MSLPMNIIVSDLSGLERIQIARGLLAGEKTPLSNQRDLHEPPDPRYKFTYECITWDPQAKVSTDFHLMYILAQEAWAYASCLHAQLVSCQSTIPATPMQTPQSNKTRLAKHASPLILQKLQLTTSAITDFDQSIDLIQTAPGKYQVLKGHELFLLSNLSGIRQVMKIYLLPAKANRQDPLLLTKLIEHYTRLVLMEVCGSSLTCPWMHYPEFRSIFAYLLITFGFSSLIFASSSAHTVCQAWNLPKATYDYYTKPLRLLVRPEPPSLDNGGSHA